MLAMAKIQTLGKVDRLIVGGFFVVMLCAIATPLLAQGRANAPNAFERTDDDREGALDSYDNTTTTDLLALTKLLQQEIYINQMKSTLIEFRLEYGDRIDLTTVYYPSGQELIPGHVFSPKGMDKNKKHPAVVMVHGGFHQSFDSTWFGMVDLLVSEGYVVMFPEYRGSKGYGSSIYQNDYGTTDAADVIAAGEYMKSLSHINSNRLGIIGQSRGGMITLLAIERAPKLFSAAVDIVGLTDFVAYMSYKPAYRRLEIAEDNPSFGGQLPDKNLPAYINASPINFVDDIESPLLVLATTGDKIVPVSIHTGRLIDALESKGKTFDSKIYENAPGGHGFMRAESKERRDADKRILDWFYRHLN